jgi:hypothetical protein
MKKLLLTTLTAFVLTGVVGGSSLASAKQEHKTVVCHIPPGNPENAHEIVVDWSAVPAHLDHGDSLGTCNATPPALPE